MSNENQETIEDIVAEMRGPYYKMGRSNASLDKDMMGYMSFMANRIEAANKREMADEKRISDAVIRSLRDKKLEMAGEIAVKEAEIARLRAALNPVLDCKVMSAMTAEIEPGKSEYCAAIIEKAQRIYNEGEENRNEGGAK